MQEYAKGFYKSQAWKECRAAYVKSVGGLCEECLKNGLYTPGVIVHHKIPITPVNIYDQSVTLNQDNLELLCRDHHAQKHSAEKRYKIDKFGKVVAL